MKLLVLILLLLFWVFGPSISLPSSPRDQDLWLIAVVVVVIVILGRIDSR